MALSNRERQATYRERLSLRGDHVHLSMRIKHSDYVKLGYVAEARGITRKDALIEAIYLLWDSEGGPVPKKKVSR